jgi:hypothetical protein
MSPLQAFDAGKEGNPRSKSASGPAARRRRDAPLVPRGSRCRAIEPKGNGRATATCHCGSAMFDFWLSVGDEALTQASIRLLDRTEGPDHRLLFKSLGIVCPLRQSPIIDHPATSLARCELVATRPFAFFFQKPEVFFQKNLLPLVAPLFPPDRKNIEASTCRDGSPRNHPSISHPRPSSGVSRRTVDMNAFNRGVWRWGKHPQTDLTQTDTLAELT